MNPHDPKDAVGQAKPQLHLLPSAGMEEQAKAHRYGAGRYGPWNWRKGKVLVSTYLSAAMRHGIAFRDGEDIDKETGAHHLGCLMANAAILLDAARHGTLVDDRPTHKDSLQVAPTPEPSQVSEEWRELGPEEKLVRGDEYLSCEPEGWEVVEGLSGWKVKDLAFKRARRRITPSDSDGKAFPEVGARVRYTCDDPQMNEGPIGTETVVSAVGKDHFHTESGGVFYAGWQDGLELVTEPPILNQRPMTPDERQVMNDFVESLFDDQPPIPEGFPPVPETPGFRKVNRGFAWNCDESGNYLYACHSWKFWNRGAVSAHGRPDGFYIELVPLPEEPTGEDCAKSDNPTVEAMKKWMDVDKQASGPEPTASYPPPENEWPEKPDAGEGMVWERQEGARVQSVNEGKFIILTSGDTPNAYWREVNPTPNLGLTWRMRTVFRAVPAPKAPDEDPSTPEVTNDAPQDPAESAAKAILNPEWLWFGKGDIINDGGNSQDIACFQSYGQWAYGGFKGNGHIHKDTVLWAIRAGTDLAAKNGLGEKSVKDTLKDEYERMKPECGDYACGYRDGLAFVISALSGKGGEEP